MINISCNSVIFFFSRDSGVLYIIYLKLHLSYSPYEIKIDEKDNIYTYTRPKYVYN